ncbi:uncharacterized protein LOC121871423 [Homarus americanus]|uniref:uncharacterized protein LOC121871423 n=1 Tax=Homarus americanus TaxID=6706 RepID=UPI001C47AFCE|nr:uncharacterized protein LOC121871423 [Homarus americanus]
MMGVRAWRWAAMVMTVVVMAGVAESLRCYKCNNCIKYELSQSQTCGPQDTHCMKMNMETGQVKRACGTEDMCTNSETKLKTKYTGVACCTGDNCNPASSASPPPLLLLLVLMFLLPVMPRLLLLSC